MELKFDGYKYAEMIDNQGISTKIIADIISDYEWTKTDLMNKYGRYKQAKESTPIMLRPDAKANKINNKLANDYLAEIVDTKTGYMFGVPATVNYDKSAGEYQTVNDQIQRFEKINNFDDFNAEMGKFAAICGFDTAVCYIDREGQERVMRLDPWETIVISKTSMTEPEYGLVYYETWDEKKRVEFYDGKNKTVYEGGSFSAAALAEVAEESKPHMFDYCPVFGVPNNAELLGDADKVISLIDAFDRSLSDMNNEIEQFRTAYMKFVGYSIDEETLEEMIATGAIAVPDSEGDVGWLVKDLNPAYIDSHLNRLEANITRFAKHVNFTDAAFGSDITGPAMRYKLFALETKAKYFERKHESALQHMFKVIGSAWSKKGIAFDFTKLDIVYTRNIPVNLLDEANTANQLMSVTSHETALSVVSVVKDVEEEMGRIQKEREESINLDDPNLLDNNKDGQAVK